MQGVEVPATNTSNRVTLTLDLIDSQSLALEYIIALINCDKEKKLCLDRRHCDVLNGTHDKRRCSVVYILKSVSDDDPIVIMVD